jgi:hypothetical protein
MTSQGHDTLPAKLLRPAIASIARAWERSPIVETFRNAPRKTAALHIGRCVVVLALVSPALTFRETIPIWAELLCVALALVIAFTDEIRAVVAQWRSGRDARRQIAKIAALSILVIVLCLAAMPFICWGIYSMAERVAELCCERRSNAYEIVMFSIAMGTIPALSLSTGVGMCVYGRRAQRRLKARQAHETNAAAVELAMAQRTNATLH